MNKTTKIIKSHPNNNFKEKPSKGVFRQKMNRISHLTSPNDIKYRRHFLSFNLLFHCSV